MSNIQKTYVQAYLPSAQKVEAKYGISALFLLAQSGLESGYAAAKPGNAMFGIKADSSWKGDKQLLRTKEVLTTDKAKFPEVISVTKRPDGKFDYVVKDWFRKYATPEDSFADYAQFLLKNKRYKTALLYKNDPVRFADEIAKAGYATDPVYAQKIKNVMGSLKSFFFNANKSNQP
ncbi:MAG: glucosaminidase domain-containing protein [Sporocytophaga sp.]|nr:glucosaminidase domain-containing protein [Sporocytophaga sp.]